MAQDKASPQERVVLGVLLLGTSLLGLSLVVGSRVDLLGKQMGPITGLARLLQLASLTAIVAAVVLAIGYLGTSGGWRLIGRELLAGFLAGGALGVVLGVVVRTIVPPRTLWVAVLALYLGGIAIVVWFAQRASTEAGTGSSGGRGALGMLGTYFVQGRAGETAQLEEFRDRLARLPVLHPTGAMVMGAGAGAGQQLLDLVSSNCGDAIQALATGRDPQGNRITSAQVGHGLRMLAHDAREDIGVVLMSLDHDGFMAFQQLLDELDVLAAGLESGGRAGGTNRAGITALVLLAFVAVQIAAGGLYLAVTPVTAPAGGDVAETPNEQAPSQAPVFSGSLVYDGQVGDEQYRIFVLDLETGVETQLTDGVDNDLAPAWSPDGERIAFSRWPNQASGADGSQLAGDVYVMDRDGTGLTGVAVSESAEWGSSWSPDGTRLLTTLSEPDDYNTFEVAVMGLDGSDLVELTANDVPDFHPEWSPDGSQVVFVRGGFDQTHVMTMNADGSNAREVTPYAGNYSDPVWSPDGKSIAFLMGPGGGESLLMVVDAGGSEMRELAIGALSPVWSPDNDWVLFARGTELRAIPYAGGSEVVITTFPHAPGSVSWHVAR